MQMIQISKDIRAYQAKSFGPFTGPQAVGVCIGGGIELLGTFLLSKIAGFTFVSLILPMVFAVIPVIFAFGDTIVSMPMDVYVKEVLLRSFKYPKYRPFTTHNYLDYLLEQDNKEQEKNIDKKELKKLEKVKRDSDREMQKNIPEELKAYQ